MSDKDSVAPLEVPAKVDIPQRLYNDLQLLIAYGLEADEEAGGLLIIAQHGNLGVVAEQIGKDREIVLEPNEDLHKEEKYVGTSHVHPVCVIGDFVLVDTERGRIPIKDVVIGDKVLSYGGEYRPVIDKIQFPYRGTQTTVELDLRGIGHRWQKLSTTANHPYRVIRDGKEQWIEAQYLRQGDLVLVPEYLIDYCKVCKKPVKLGQTYCSQKCSDERKKDSWINPNGICYYCGKSIKYKRRWWRFKYCSLTCHMKHAHELGVATPGEFDNYNPDFQRKAKLARFATAKNGSRWEKVVYDYLVSQGLEGLEKQYPVYLGTYKTYGGARTIPKFCYMDIAIPSKKIDIEIDGEIWHSMRKRTDEERDAKLKELGWTIIRIPARKVASEEYTAILSTILPIKALEDPPISFVPIPIRKVTNKPAKHTHAIGLTVKGNSYDENSFVTNGILTHNTNQGSTGDFDGYLKDENEKVMLVMGADKSINVYIKTPLTVMNPTEEPIIKNNFEQKDLLEVAESFGILYYRATAEDKTVLTLLNKKLGGQELKPLDETWPIEHLIEALGIKGLDRLPEAWSSKKWPKKNMLKPEEE